MMMMTGNHPPPSDLPSDPTALIHSPISRTFSSDGSHYDAALVTLQRFLPSNDDFDFPMDAFSCDDFRMFEFKVKKCVLARSHDWTACPFAHPGEKARRRDPRRYHYSGGACPDFRKGMCRRGDGCEYAHGVFECWLHPARYRTQPCKDGTHCRRRVCFFAHTPEQLRVLPYSEASSSSPGRFGVLVSSPPPSPPMAGSPPVSPSGSVNMNRVGQLAASMRSLQITKTELSLSPSWGFGFGSPPTIRPGSLSLPSTPIRRGFDPWTSPAPWEEEPAVERVESGRELRERIYAKLGKENSLERAGRVDPNVGSGQDFGWVGELVN